MPFRAATFVPISHNRLQILIGDRLDDIPILVEHPNIAAAIAGTLLSVIQSVLACVLAAVFLSEITRATFASLLRSDRIRKGRNASSYVIDNIK